MAAGQRQDAIGASALSGIGVDDPQTDGACLPNHLRGQGRTQDCRFARFSFVLMVRHQARQQNESLKSVLRGHAR